MRSITNNMLLEQADNWMNNAKADLARAAHCLDLATQRLDSINTLKESTPDVMEGAHIADQIRALHRIVNRAIDASTAIDGLAALAKPIEEVGKDRRAVRISTPSAPSSTLNHEGTMGSNLVLEHGTASAALYACSEVPA